MLRIIIIKFDRTDQLRIIERRTCEVIHIAVSDDRKRSVSGERSVNVVAELDILFVLLCFQNLIVCHGRIGSCCCCIGRCCCFFRSIHLFVGRIMRLTVIRIRICIDSNCGFSDHICAAVCACSVYHDGIRMCTGFGIDTQSGVSHVIGVGINMKLDRVAARIKPSVAVLQIEGCLISDARAFAETEIRCAAFVKAAMPVADLQVYLEYVFVNPEVQGFPFLESDIQINRTCHFKEELAFQTGITAVLGVSGCVNTQERVGCRDFAVLDFCSIFELNRNGKAD